MHRSSCCRWYLNIIHEQTKRSVLLWTGSSWRARREGRGGPTWNCWTCRRTRRTRRRRAQRKPSMRTRHTRTYTDCRTDQWAPISLLCLIIDLFVLISGSCWFPWWSRPPWWGWTQSKCRFWMIHVYLFICRDVKCGSTAADSSVQPLHCTFELRAEPNNPKKTSDIIVFVFRARMVLREREERTEKQENLWVKKQRCRNEGLEMIQLLTHMEKK